MTFKTSSAELCCVPTFISAFLAAGLGFAAAAPPAPAATAPAVVVCRNSLRCIFGLQLKAHLVTTGETPSSAQRVERSRLAYTRAARLLREWRTARAIA